MKKQKQFTIKTLNENGQISRNYCLQNYFSRLASVIEDLRNNDHWEIETISVKTEHGRDTVYKLISKPIWTTEKLDVL